MACPALLGLARLAGACSQARDSRWACKQLAWFEALGLTWPYWLRKSCMPASKALRFCDNNNKMRIIQHASQQQQQRHRAKVCSQSFSCLALKSLGIIRLEAADQRLQGKVTADCAREREQMIESREWESLRASANAHLGLWQLLGRALLVAGREAKERSQRVC